MPRGNFGKVIVPDENLSKIIGNKPLKVTEMTKAIWAYIKAHDLMKDEEN